MAVPDTRKSIGHSAQFVRSRQFSETPLPVGGVASRDVDPTSRHTRLAGEALLDPALNLRAGDRADRDSDADAAGAL